MKILTYLLIATITLLSLLVQAQPTCYLQLYPGDNTKIIFQIAPDQDYSDVAIGVNFYNSAGDTIRSNKRFLITSPGKKYLLASEGVYSFVLAHTLQDVDHVDLASISEKVTRLELHEIGNGTVHNPDFFPYTRGISITPANSSNPLRDVNSSQPVNGFLHPKNTISAAVHENFIVRSSFICDLKTTDHATQGDFQWSVDNAIGSIIPSNGARFFLMWSCPGCYDTISVAGLNNLDQRGLLTANTISLSHVRPGALIAFMTRDGVYGILRIERYIRGAGIDLQLSERIFAR